MLPPLRFHPLPRERVWGGRRLESLFGKSLPYGVPVGETWELSDRPDAVSQVCGGSLDGWTLRELMEQRGAEIMGSKLAPGGRFPWLCKILDASADLSLQVHPPASVDPPSGQEPKTEMWYVVAAEPGSRILAGLRPGVDRRRFEAAAADGTVAGCFHEIPVRTGDVMFVPSGRVHALGAGLVVFEIQQNSDTTYRVYDWGRVGLDGKPRALHLEQSLDSIDFSDVCPSLSDPDWQKSGSGRRRCLVDSPVFRIDEMEGSAGGMVEVGAADGPVVLVVISGRGVVTNSAGRLDAGPGEFVLLGPGEGKLESREETRFLRVSHP